MMRKESAKLLSELAAKYPKRTLLALCCDLRALEKADLEEFLAASTKEARPAKRTGRKRKELPFDDTPASRIEHLLVKKAAMAEPQAADKLKRQLLQQGVGASRIPPLGGRRFGDWLTDLFAVVPASRVMHAALQLSRQPRG